MNKSREAFVFAALIVGSLAGHFLFSDAPLALDEKVPVSGEILSVAQGRAVLTDAPREYEYAVVKRVIDGDTLELANGERLRYIGIEAPELVHPEEPIECFAREAAARNRELVEGKEVRLERDISDRDRYGRLLRYVWVGERMINLKLVEEGYASAAAFPPDVKYADEFVVAERRARETNSGLWMVCR